MRELVFDCPGQQAEALSDALLEAGALSVSVEDADRDTADEQPLFGEPGLEPDSHAWQRNLVVALLPDGVDPAQLFEQALSIHQENGSTLPESCTDWQLREVPDADWVRLTQAQFAPIPVGDRVWIVPSWHTLPAEARPDAIAIQLDPGLAFGTGSHPTTHLCLQWLVAHLQPGTSVLDYGCGSGILAIAARKLGAGTTHAIDIDEQAVQATGDNALNNQVELIPGLPNALPAGTHDLVIANILSNPLKVLAPMLSGRVAPDGHLVLSGVLERQAEEVAAVYAPWISLSVWRAHDGWVCLHGQRS